MATNTRPSTIWGMFFWPILGSETEEENYQRVCLSDLRALRNVSVAPFVLWEPVGCRFFMGGNNQQITFSEMDSIQWNHHGTFFYHTSFIPNESREFALTRSVTKNWCWVQWDQMWVCVKIKKMEKEKWKMWGKERKKKIKKKNEGTKKVGLCQRQGSVQSPIPSTQKH